MVGNWATFASHFAEDDPLLLPSPEFHDDDDPSSYLLYPPGFGPIVDWPIDGRNLPMLAGDAAAAADPCESGRKDADLVVSGGREEAAAEGPGALELLGLSEALSGKVSLVGGGESGYGGKDGVVEYMVIGGLENSFSGHGDVDLYRASGAGGRGEGGGSVVRLEMAGSKESSDGAREAPPVVKTEVKVEYDDGETNLRSGESSESESDASSSSSSSSSSEESSEDEEEEVEDDDNDRNDDDKDGRDGGNGQTMDAVVDFEEGEIREPDAEGLAMSSDDDEDAGAKRPVRSKNELEVLPPVPPVKATLEQHHRTLPVGVISSVVGTKVIIEGIEKHNPLNEGSILWITDSRSPLGLVDEIFGPVKNPYYIVRFNSEKEIPDGISEGTAISFVVEFANHILNDPALYKKGYDASGENDEEVCGEVEFSDDEKEAEYKRSVRQVKRGTDNRRQRDQESLGKKKVQFEKRRFQTKTTGFGKRKDVQPVVPGAFATISQPPNVTSQLQPTLHQPLASGALALVSQPPNVQSQIQSTPQQPFNSGQVPAPSQPPRVPGQVQAPAQPHWLRGQVQAPVERPFVPGQVEAPSQLSCAPGRSQAPPPPPPVLGQLQAPPQQHCVPGQLQALQTSLQQSCVPGQLHGPTPSPYILGPLQAPTLPPCVPGLQVPTLSSNVAGGDLTSFLAGNPCFSGPPTVPAIPYGGQLGGPFGLGQQNFVMPQSNALWATQQFITSLSSMFPNNGIPPQQQDHHPFHQNQNQLFPGFNNGMPFQHHLLPNQGIPPNMMSWQGGLPNPSIGPRPLEPMGRDSLGQAPSGQVSSGEQGGFGLSNCNQNPGQSERARAQGDMRAPTKFNLGNSSVRGRKPYGRGGRMRRS